jgi:hypothetical protein
MVVEVSLLSGCLDGLLLVGAMDMQLPFHGENWTILMGMV